MGRKWSKLLGTLFTSIKGMKQSVKKWCDHISDEDDKIAFCGNCDCHQ